MRIPLGNLGDRVADVPGGPRPQQGDYGVGEAAQRLGGTVTGLALHEIEQQRHEDRGRALVAQRAQAAFTLAQISNEAHDKHDDVSRRVLDGTLDPNKAEGELSSEIAKLRDDRLQSLNEEQRGAISDNVLTLQGNLTRNLRGVVIKRTQNDTAGFIDGFAEQTQRDVMRIGPVAASEKMNAMVDFTGPAAGLQPLQAAKLKQASSERFHAAYFGAKAVDGLSRGDLPALAETLKQIRGKEGEPLDPVRRTELELRTYGYQQQLLARQDRADNEAERARVARENDAVGVYNKAADLALGGQYFDKGLIDELTSKGAGTPHEKDIASLIAGQRQVAGFASRGAAERTSLLEKWRSEGATPGVGTNPLGAKFLAAAEAMDAKMRGAFKDNAFEAAQKAGVIERAPLLDPTNPQQALEIVAERMKTIGVVEAWGGAKTSPLQPLEADTAAKFLKAMPPDQAATFLGKLGAIVGDQERVAALTQQMHQKDPTIGLSMSYASTQTTEGRHVSELILRGDQKIKDGVVKPDATKETGWKSEIAKEIRGAYSNQEVENQVVRAAFLIAAEKGGDIGNAIRLATGGGIVNFNGSKVPMPVGYSSEGNIFGGGQQSAAEDRFRKAISNIPPEQLMPQATDGNVYAGGVPMRASDFLASLKDAQLVHAGQGAYNVKAGNGLVTNRDGRRITIRLP